MLAIAALMSSIQLLSHKYVIFVDPHICSRFMGSVTVAPLKCLEVPELAF